VGIGTVREEEGVGGVERMDDEDEVEDDEVAVEVEVEDDVEFGELLLVYSVGNDHEVFSFVFLMIVSAIHFHHYFFHLYHSDV